MILTAPIPVLVINLDADLQRWAALTERLAGAGAFTLERIPGIPGSVLPQLACDVLTKTPDYPVGRGTLGVFLAHVAVWEAVATKDVPFCLVLEDDAELVEIGRLATFTFPPGIDLVFCHDNMTPDGDRPEPLACLDISVGLRRLVETGNAGVEACGYLLTPAGAACLLRAVRHDLCFGHVDWRMLRYCMTPALIEETISGTRVAEILRDHHHWERPLWGVISGGVLSAALVRHASVVSRRAAQDALAGSVSRIAGSVHRIIFEGRGTTFHISDPTDHIQSFIAHGEFYQARHLTFHRDLVPLGSTVVDVGANIGNHTLFYAKHTWAARVYPIEPNPPAQALLLQTVAANQDSDCRARIMLDHVGFAIGDRLTWGMMTQASARNLGASVMVPANGSEAGAVRCVPLDSLAFEGQVGFIKVDVEGHELDVLAGARDMIAQYRPFIAIEVSDRNEAAFWDWMDCNAYHVIQLFADYFGNKDFLIAPTARRHPH